MLSFYKSTVGKKAIMAITGLIGIGYVILHVAGNLQAFAGREKLKAMQAAKSKLEIDVANLEARLEMVKVAQSTSEFNFDDSQLSRTKDLVKDISARIDVAEKLVNSETTYPGQISLEEEPTSDITEQITKYFEESEDKDDTVAVKLD